MKYPIGIQDFAKIRKDGYVYIDKTKLVYDIASLGSYYFLGRPRRFGKSLLISTFEAYFSGKKELFAGLDIEKLEKDWETYPILHLDLNTRKYDTKEAMLAELNKNLEAWETVYGDKFKDRAPEERLSHIIEFAYKQTGKRVVLLVDEYDKPLLQTIGNAALQDEYRNILKAFYSVVKTYDKYIKFGFFTGVTKFGKVSVFSDLNNLQDISMDKRYIDVCGITEEEIHRYFEEPLQELAKANGMTYDEAAAKLKEQYDGYHFEYGTEGIYNPFSLLNTFAKQSFKDYWFETGTPTFLVQLLQERKYVLPDLTHEIISDDVLNSIDSASRNPIPLIYQSGYLTIKGYDSRFKRYRLGFPNNEVETGFLNFLLPYYTPNGDRTEFDISHFVIDVESGNAEQFMRRLQAMLADTDYKIVGDAELYFQNALYLIFKIMGFYVEVERATSDRRMDVLIKTSDYIYIIECKLDKSADDALRQIEENNYAAPFLMDNRKVYKIGVSFSSKTRGVEEWRIK